MRRRIIRLFRSVYHTRSRLLYTANREKARILVKERLLHYNQFYGFSVGRVAIRNQRSRWGSCSKKGNLNFNYKIVFLSPEMVDYIIVHELCHIGEFNHSKNFWALVAQTVPDYKKIRMNLKKVGSVL